MSKLKWRIILSLALVALAFCGTAAAQAIYVNEGGSVVCGCGSTKGLLSEVPAYDL